MSGAPALWLPAAPVTAPAYSHVHTSFTTDFQDLGRRSFEEGLRTLRANSDRNFFGDHQPNFVRQSARFGNFGGTQRSFGEFRQTTRTFHPPRQTPAPVTYFVPWLLSTTLVTAALPNPNADMKRLKVIYQWNQLDYEYPSQAERDMAIADKTFIPENNLPLGLEVWENRIFVTMPRWKPGVPATLATVPRNPPPGGMSPSLRPYPDWSWHTSPTNCDGLTSVFRLAVDPCGRLWVLDSGTIDATIDPKQVCPSKIAVFDLRTDKLLWRYDIPKDQIKEGSLFTNIAVDVREGKCEEAYAYVADVWRFAIVVYDWKQNRSWRITHNFFFPDPIAAEFHLHGVDFRWTDGVFGLALGPYDHRTRDRALFFHPMASFREFSVPTSILRNMTAADDKPEAFKAMGEPRGDSNMHSSASGMDRTGVLFYNLVTSDSIGCWNSNQPLGYRRDLQGIVDRSNVTINFPNDLKVDLEPRQSVWVLSNKLHYFLYRKLDSNEVNFRIMRAYTDEAIKGTVCDHNYSYVPSNSVELGSRTQCPN